MKKEQENYAERLEKRPPEGLVPWLLEHKWYKRDYLIYRAGYETDYMTGIKTKVVNAVCTACGSDMVLDYAAGPACASYAPAPFGFILPSGETTISGNNCLCPCCGAQVRAVHIGQFRERIIDDVYPLTFGRIDNKLVVYLWCIRQCIDKHGNVRYEDWPYEAYVVEEKKLVRLVGYVKSTNSIHLNGNWTQRQRMYDSLGAVKPYEIYGEVGAAIQGTTADNSKLDIYMQLHEASLFPVTYLAVYKKHPNIENLLTSGCGEMIAKEIQRDRSYASYYTYSGTSWRMPPLTYINWKETKPFRMLGITKEEMKRYIELGIDLSDIAFTKEIRKKEPLSLEDVALIKKYGFTPTLELFNSCETIRNGRTVMRCLRYLEKQKDMKVYDLRDYWRMAQRLEYDLNDDAVFFPKNLKREHDRIDRELKELQAKKDAEERAAAIAARAPLFEKRRAALTPFEFHESGLLIRPCADEAELIREGKILSHCVARYASSICSGQTAIFFIRKEEEAEKPYFTLEFDEKKQAILQNRGKQNCDPPEAVKRFAADWLTWVQESHIKPKKQKKQIA